jgi:hypothetical protein
MKIKDCIANEQRHTNSITLDTILTHEVQKKRTTQGRLANESASNSGKDTGVLMR